MYVHDGGLMTHDARLFPAYPEGTLHKGNQCIEQ